MSDILNLAAQLLIKEGHHVERKEESDESKGLCIVEIAIAVGASLAANAIYDALKVGIRRSVNHGDKTKRRLEIDGKSVALDDLGNGSNKKD